MLSQKAKYALKALFHLAGHPSGQLVQVADIAEAENVPKKFLELILLQLKSQGLVYSLRGKNGGYALARPPSQIMVGQIIRIIDGPLAPLPCASLSGYRKCDDCNDENACAVRAVMRRVRDAMAEIVDKTTLADALATSRFGARAAAG